MTFAAECLLVQVIKDFELARSLSVTDWDLLVRQARRANLLASLACDLDQRGLNSAIPEAAGKHFFSARKLASAHERAIRWEVRCIYEALTHLDIPVVLLKGGAYLMAELPVSQGRFFSDIDVMVPRHALTEAEAALGKNGWATTHHDAYDQRYYRTWMHELPPLRHSQRNSVLDVHHTILPLTARLSPDPDKLFSASLLLENGARVLSGVDMVLHSAVHLFHDGELENGLRDLADLDSLLRHFGKDERFWSDLVERARELGLERPLYYAVHYTNRMLATPVPDSVIAATRDGAPAAILRWIMDSLFMRGLLPEHSSCDTRSSGLARWALYVRSHALRMPVHLLLPHLLRKSYRRWRNPGEGE